MIDWVNLCCEFEMFATLLPTIFFVVLRYSRYVKPVLKL